MTTKTFQAFVIGSKDASLTDITDIFGLQKRDTAIELGLLKKEELVKRLLDVVESKRGSDGNQRGPDPPIPDTTTTKKKGRKREGTDFFTSSTPRGSILSTPSTQRKRRKTTIGPSYPNSRRRGIRKERGRRIECPLNISTKRRKRKRTWLPPSDQTGKDVGDNNITE
jgi:hypothetical protein